MPFFILGLVLSCANLFGSTQIQYQSSFSSGDKFVVLNKARVHSNGEYKGIGFRQNGGGAFSLGRLNHTAAVPAELAAKVQANSASDTNNRAPATVLAGNFGGPTATVDVTCYSGYCDAAAGHALGALPTDSTYYISANWCFTLDTSCTPSTSYDESGATFSLMDGESMCAVVNTYDYVSSGGSFQVQGSGEVVCKLCNCP